MTEVPSKKMLQRSLLCYLGFHDYRRIKTIGDKDFQRCRRCYSSRYVEAKNE